MALSVSAANQEVLGILARAGPAEAAEVAQKLQEASTRYAALCTLSKLGTSVSGKFVDDIIAQCLPDKDSRTRAAAAAAIGNSADAVLASGSASKIAELLKSEDPGVRCGAAVALGKFGEKGAAFASNVAELLKDDAEDDSETYLWIGGSTARTPAMARRPKCAALMALGKMGAGSFAGACAEALSDDNYEVRLCALECLAQLGDAGRNQSSKIANCLEDDLFVVRAKACECIAALKAEDQMGSLADLFEDKAPAVRQAALTALVECPHVARTYSSEVYKCLNDELPAVRACAISLLGHLGEISRSYASVIATCLNDQDAAVRGAACKALGGLGDYGACFSEEVSYCLRDEDQGVREAAARALDSMGSEALRYAEEAKRILAGEASRPSRPPMLALGSYR